MTSQWNIEETHYPAPPAPPTPDVVEVTPAWVDGMLGAVFASLGLNSNEVLDRAADSLTEGLHDEIDLDTVMARIVEEAGYSLSEREILEAIAEDYSSRFDESDIAGAFDESDIAAGIDLSDLAHYLDLGGIASEIDLNEVAQQIDEAAVAESIGEDLRYDVRLLSERVERIEQSLDRIRDAFATVAGILETWRA